MLFQTLKSLNENQLAEVIQIAAKKGQEIIDELYNLVDNDFDPEILSISPLLVSSFISSAAISAVSKKLNITIQDGNKLHQQILDDCFVIDKTIND
ncbi:MAG TPA: hypothetical protein VJ279_11885 [Hanamia sp.]|jgi:hypothetical protein|nr:hypothetical protein [Hanamia sp.]